MAPASITNTYHLKQEQYASVPFRNVADGRTLMNGAASTSLAIASTCWGFEQAGQGFKLARRMRCGQMAPNHPDGQIYKGRRRRRPG